jgi:tetracycline 7-halogenase / FADH2 O2-dependent halogenase
MLPSAALFIDPLFSTGMPLTLLGIERLARLMATQWDNADAFQCGLEELGQITLEEGDSTARFVAGCHAAMGHFPQFAALSMFYFAAASFSEMARRLDRRTMTTRYLAANHSEFTASRNEFTDRLVRGDFNFEMADVARAVDVLNVAGVADSVKRNWYGVDLQDVIRNAQKLDYTPETLQPILATADWAQC